MSLFAHDKRARRATLLYALVGRVIDVLQKQILTEHMTESDLHK